MIDGPIQYARMKYVIIIPDGAADFPLEELGGKTPFEAARIPHTDRLALEGRIGTVSTTPPGLRCGSDVCCMSLLGYDPHQYYTGRAPVEAAAMGISLGPSDWVFRVNLVTIIDGVMQDHSAGHISSEEGRLLLSEVAARQELPGMTLYPGVSYRNILVDSPGPAGGHDRIENRRWDDLVTTPPHDILNEPIKKHLPHGGPGAALLQKLISDSQELFAYHEVNQTRRELGELPATHLWPWGQGRIKEFPSFESRFGLRAAVITAVDLMAGIAQLIGWDRLDVPGQTSYHDTDYAAAGRHAIAALGDYDLVCVHIEAPDEAGHAADAPTKVAALEAIDEYIVGPIRQALEQSSDDWRILYAPDHYTAVSTRMHDPTPVPFLMCGKNIQSVLRRPFTEQNVQHADLHIAKGHELMEYFLYSGLQATPKPMGD